MAKFFGLDRLWYLFKIVRQTGGIRASYYKMFIMDTLKIGTLVGTDANGNKYYDNPRFFYGRNRWVEYNPKYGLDYDGAQVTAEWFGWLHYKTDIIPTSDPSRPYHKWMAEHTENMSGTTEQFTPYSTTRPKIKPWKPKPC